jgi:hypothetical protein
MVIESNGYGVRKESLWRLKVIVMAGAGRCADMYSGATVVLQWCYSGVTVVLQWCYSGVTVVLQWRYSGVTDGTVLLKRY